MDKEREREKKSPPLPPTPAEVKDYVYSRHYDFDAEKFFSYYTARGWRLGTQPMADWRAAADTWAKDEAAHRQRYGGGSTSRTESREEYNRKMQDCIRRLNESGHLKSLAEIRTEFGVDPSMSLEQYRATCCNEESSP